MLLENPLQKHWTFPRAGHGWAEQRDKQFLELSVSDNRGQKSMYNIQISFYVLVSKTMFSSCKTKLQCDMGHQ